MENELCCNLWCGDDLVSIPQRGDIPSPVACCLFYNNFRDLENNQAEFGNESGKDRVIKAKDPVIFCIGAARSAA